MILGFFYSSPSSPSSSSSPSSPSPQKGKVLKEKGAARIYVERNLYEDFCREGTYVHTYKYMYVCAIHPSTCMYTHDA